MKKPMQLGLETRPVTVPLCVSLALCLNFMLEMISRRSFWGTFTYLSSYPLRFLTGGSIILVTLLLSQFLRRQVFHCAVISCFWLILGAVNSTLLAVRSTPLSAADLAMLRYAASIWRVYFTPWQTVLLCLGILALVAAGISLWRRAPKLQLRPKSVPAALLTGGLLMVLLGGSAAGLFTAETESTDLQGTYEEYGLAYCLSKSFFERDMTVPRGYGERPVTTIVDALPEESAPASPPNILFLQLESWLDLSRVTGLKLDGQPAPNYSALRASCTGGLLTTPTIGGGTIFTEFEVLTGLRMDLLGSGAYPFATIVEKTTVDSLAYAFGSLGYTTTAIHNHTGTFYDRHLGYSQLGFDIFSSLEFMPDGPTNGNGWAEDALLLNQILQTLSQTEGPDYIHAVSVQTHGSYPTQPSDRPSPVTVLSDIEEEDRYALDYYIEQMLEVDAFIGALVQALSALEEDVALVIYGDHLPSLECLYDLDEGDKYDTEYVIWTNFDLPREQVDLQAWELGSYLQERLGIQAGIMPRFHQSMSDDDPSYENRCALLQYDLLYGLGWSYGGGGKPIASDMVFGTTRPVVKRLIQGPDGIEIWGTGFNSYSVVYIDGAAVNTHALSPTKLLTDVQAEPGMEIVISQITAGGDALYSTAPVAFPD